MKRVVYSFVLFISLFLLPWWVSGLLAFAGLFLFASYYEFLIASIVMYALYCVPGQTVLSSPLWYSCIIGCTYGAVALLRDRIILYTHHEI